MQDVNGTMDPRKQGNMKLLSLLLFLSKLPFYCKVGFVNRTKVEQ